MSRKKAPVASNGHHDPDDTVDYPAPAPVPAEDLAPAGAGEKRPPAFVSKIGPLKVCVWLNMTKEGRPFYGVTTARVYKNGDGEWAQSYSYGKNDLLPLAEALREAFHWIAANPLSYDDDTPF